MLHEEFADRVTGRLETTAEEPEGGARSLGNDSTAVRARVLRPAADVALQEAATVIEEESPAPLARSQRVAG